MGEINLTRQQLYNLVWSKPLSKLAKEYSISDNGLRKICKRMNIPLPQNGHWQKVNYGKKIKPVRLPKTNIIYKSISLSKRTGKINLDEQTPETRLRKQIEKENKDLLIIPEKLTKPDVLVRNAKRTLKSKKPNNYSRQIGIVKTDFNELSIAVSPSNIIRAAIFMDCFIKLLRARNHNIEINGNTTYVVINDEKINFRLVEKCKRVIVPGRIYNSSELHANDKLSIKYDESFIEKEVMDSKTKTIEDRLSLIIAKLELRAEEITKENIRIEKWHQERLRKEAIEDVIKKRKKEEIKKLETLISNSNLHFEANKIRTYVKMLVNHSKQEGKININVLEYKKWALNKANWIDPLVDYEDDILNKPEKLFPQII
mgnify:CR=1 FL=1